RKVSWIVACPDSPLTKPTGMPGADTFQWPRNLQLPPVPKVRAMSTRVLVFMDLAGPPMKHGCSATSSEGISQSMEKSAASNSAGVHPLRVGSKAAPNAVRSEANLASTSASSRGPKLSMLRRWSSAFPLRQKDASRLKLARASDDEISSTLFLNPQSSQSR